MSQGVIHKIPPLGPLNFKERIDLMDETLREGAERSPVSPTVEAKYQVARKLSDTGLKSLVIGMFPDVPENITFLRRLLEGQRAGDIAGDVRFIVVSHIGAIFEQTLRALDGLKMPLDTVWIIAVHSVSDMQIEHLMPKILLKDKSNGFDLARWKALTQAQRREEDLRWYEKLLPAVSRYQGGGIVAGLLDTFRSDMAHVNDAIEMVSASGIRQVRLVDTAGTCMPHQLPLYVGEPVKRFPHIDFYAHLHSDFGMGTGNALTALSLGARGVDVSVGGFANRAGHPAVGEVAAALHYLYGIDLPGFKYDSLFGLSRAVEDLFGLMECPTGSVTGVITHGIMSGIRTELEAAAPEIFDVIKGDFVGASYNRVFGSRSGTDGVHRFMLMNRDKLAAAGIEVNEATSLRAHALLMKEWDAQSQRQIGLLRDLKNRYHQALDEINFTEDKMLALLLASELASPEESLAR
jgi:homocitrate synthase NifV